MTAAYEPLVSVILPSWQRKKDILQTLATLRNQTYSRREIIVIDQNSTDGGPEEIAKGFPEVQVVRLDKNIGPGAARNLGAEKASGEILVFIDNDAGPEATVLAKVVERFKEDGSLGLIGFSIHSFYTREIELVSWTYQKDKLKDCDKEFETYTFCGTGYAMPKRVFEAGARYWDGIFFSAEEAELSFRILKMGYRIIYFPKARVYHRASQEGRMSLGKRNFLGFRNNLWIVWKYYPFLEAVKATFIRTGVYLVKGLRGGFFFWILLGFLAAFRKSGLLLTRRDRLDRSAWARYKKLSYKGPWLKVIQAVFSRPADPIKPKSV